MNFHKKEDTNGDLVWVYFVDDENRIQGDLFCYKTLGKFPAEENLVYIESYKDGIVLHKEWMTPHEMLTS